MRLKLPGGRAPARSAVSPVLSWRLADLERIKKPS